jgi:hypothetical protein
MHLSLSALLVVVTIFVDSLSSNSSGGEWLSGKLDQNWTKGAQVATCLTREFSE